MVPGNRLIARLSRQYHISSTVDLNDEKFRYYYLLVVSHV
jgi:hypothetical protein